MKKNLSDSLNSFFSTEPDAEEKAWEIIHDFYHEILTFMEKNGIKKSELAKRLGKSRSAITQMFNKTPNITIKKLVEIADAVGIEFELKPKEKEITIENNVKEHDFVVNKKQVKRQPSRIPPFINQDL